ncbi:MAG TPA: AMIN domain-containing protein, partial [Blastocatellia bacterium]|nr:AMIN domain-containing protein [Blastocatellia bacterium]
MAMIARRLVVSLMLLALVSNVSVFAGLNAGARAEAFALVSLKHETEGLLTRILIESSAPPLYTVFRSTDRLIVIDLPGGEASKLEPEYSVKSALVESITVRQSRVGGSPAGRAMARIEVSVRADARDRSTVNGNTLVLEVTPDTKPARAGARLEKNTAVEAKDAKRVSETHNGAAAPGVMVYSAPVAKSSTPASAGPAPERVKPRPSDLKPATLIRGFRSEAAGGAVRIVIDADGAAQYKDFVLPNPWRIVVDITGVRSAFGNKTTVVGAGLVERFRVGQPSPNVVRLVLDTKSKVSYRVVREGEALVITIGDPSGSREDSPTPKVEVKAEQNPVKDAAAPQAKPEVRVAGDRVENKTDSKKPAEPAKDPLATENLLAQAGGQSAPPRVTPQPNRALPLPSQPTSQPGAAKSAAQPAQPSVIRSATDVQRSQSNPAGQVPKRGEIAFCDPGYV